MARLDKDYRTVDDGIEIVADDASEIQPAIDEISEDVADGNVSGGTVRLKAKEYYPTSTIRLKRGVTLRGARRSHKHRTGGGDSEDHRQTTILTSGLETGPESYTWHHFNEAEDREHFDANAWSSSDYTERSHPHYPLVLGYDRQPIERDRERTTYEKRHRGHGAGLESLNLHADEKRWWKVDDGASDHWSDPEHARYFGVFDGYIFEGLDSVHVENVEVTGFHGYGGFYGDATNVVSRGNFYSAGSTDYHGSALSLSTAGLEPSGTHGVWDVQVDAPTPAVELAGAAPRAKFVTGAWSRGKIDGDGTRFLGTERDFDANDHPIGPDPRYKHDCVFHTAGSALIDGYLIGKDGGGVGVSTDHGDLALANCRIYGDHAGVRVAGSGTLGHNVRFGGSTAAIYCDGWQGSWSNCILGGGAADVVLTPDAIPEAGFDHVRFDSTYALATETDGSGGYKALETAVSLNHPDLRAVPVEDGIVADRDAFVDAIDVSVPTGYKNAVLNQLGSWREKQKPDSFTGDGGTEYSAAHRMDEVPVHVAMLPRSDAAQNAWPATWSADETEVTFSFAEPIPDGAELALNWTAFGWTHPMHNVQG